MAKMDQNRYNSQCRVLEQKDARDGIRLGALKHYSADSNGDQPQDPSDRILNEELLNVWDCDKYEGILKHGVHGVWRCKAAAINCKNWLNSPVQKVCGFCGEFK